MRFHVAGIMREIPSVAAAPALLARMRARWIDRLVRYLTRPNRESPLRGLRAVAPYVTIEVLLPGGSLIALATWLYQRRRALQRIHDQSAT